MIPDAPSVTVSFVDGDSPTVAERRLLEAWAKSRGKALRLPSPDPPVATLRGTPDDVERLLGEARSLHVEGKDGDAAARLEEAKNLLKAHPEWPEAAWLLAEVLRSSGNEGEARSLDGIRLRGIGEPPPEGDARDAPSVPLSVQTEDANDVAFVDGRPFSSYPTAADDARALREGRHALLVTRHGRTIYAAWLDLGKSLRTVTIPSPAWACTEEDLAHGPNVDCPSWARVRRVHGRLGVTSCSRASCDEVESLLVFPSSTLPPSPKRPPHAPVWVTATAIGAGIALFSLGALYTAGAFDRDPVPVRFVSGGVKPASFGFPSF